MVLTFKTLVADLQYKSIFALYLISPYRYYTLSCVLLLYVAYLLPLLSELVQALVLWLAPVAAQSAS